MQTSSYFSNLEAVLQQVNRTQYPAIARAADCLTRCLERGGMLYAFGTGHSNLLAMELFYRAGGLVRVYPLFDEDMLLYKSASASSQYERRSGIAAGLIARCDLDEDDILLVISNSGRNCMPVEAALAAKQRGAPVIALTNMRHEMSVRPNNPYGKMLHEVADIVLDNCGVAGDAVLESKDLNVRFGPTSTAAGAAILWEMIRIAIEKMLLQGIKPEVFVSANLEGGDAFNAALIEKYRSRIPCL